MTAAGNEIIASIPADPLDITIGALVEFLWEHPQARLTFRQEGVALRTGYHVTEVKAGQFAALDCGANEEAWTEIFLQLWDVDDSPEQMTARKFTAIIRKVTDKIGLDASARLTFEVSDGVRPMQLYRAAQPRLENGEIIVDLSPRAASCKPRDRWLSANPVSCCGPARAA